MLKLSDEKVWKMLLEKGDSPSVIKAVREFYDKQIDEMENFNGTCSGSAKGKWCAYAIVENGKTLCKYSHICEFQRPRRPLDAQIDKQAKTMEELWDMFNLPVPLEAREKINKWNGRHTKDTLLFGYAVGFFLAAGGTIKTYWQHGETGRCCIMDNQDNPGEGYSEISKEQYDIHEVSISNNTGGTIKE